MSIQLLAPMTHKLFEKLTLKRIKKHTEERNLLNASHFGFQADHRTTLRRMRLTDHITQNFNNNTLMAAVFLDIKKPFKTTWHSVNCQN
jgi:hypothetical protein